MSPKSINSFYIVGKDEVIANMFVNRGWTRVEKPLPETLVVFTGGEDVSPELYGEERHPTTGNSLRRDTLEMLEYHRYLEHNKVGICRGGQFLNVMNGGRMWQNVNNHALYDTHDLIDLTSGEIIPVTSTHHQMMRPKINAIWIATAKEATKLETADEVVDVSGHEPDFELDFDGDEVEVWDCEVVLYDESNSLCFQPHPEYGIKPCEDYFFNTLKRVGF